MALYDEKSETYVPLNSSRSLEDIAEGNQNVKDFEDFNVDEPDYIKDGAKETYIEELSEGMLTKAKSSAVRKIVSRFMRWCGYWVLAIKSYFKDMTAKQDDLDKRQTSLDRRMRMTIANVTKDSEVINARHSDQYGEFTVLDDRIENIEKLLKKYTPYGTEITIKRENVTNPTVFISTWRYGLGMVPLGTEPEGMFGGTTPESVRSDVVSWNNDLIVLSIPEEYSNFEFWSRVDDNNYLLAKDEKSLMITFSDGVPVGEENNRDQLTIKKATKK